MKLNISVQNLGVISQGNIQVKPITVLAGKNGTGKSFFTKMLYSILNVCNRHVLHSTITLNITFIIEYLGLYLNAVSFKSEQDEVIIKKLISDLVALKEELNYFNEIGSVNIYSDFVKSKQEPIESLLEDFKVYTLEVKKKKRKWSSIKQVVEHILDQFEKLLESFKDPKNIFIKNLNSSLKDEIKENFQVSSLKEIVLFGEDESEISDEGVFSIQIKNNSLGWKMQAKFLDEVSNLSEVVFFESPTYWRVREPLLKAREALLFQRELIGAPKYFYDLNDKLSTKLKLDNENDELLSSIQKELYQTLGGRFVFSGGELVFEDKNGHEISKNLVSSGMTSLGMILALIETGIISKGSFVFFDEPETNLHPEWQVLLVKALIELAKREINVVIATHSINVLKALEVSLKIDDDLDEQKINELLSVSFFETDGTIAVFEEEGTLAHLANARGRLTEPYEELFLKELYYD